MNLLLFILIAYGISNILIFGSIFNGWRTFWEKHNPSFFGALFTCMICLPTYVGFIGSWLIWSPTEFYGVVTSELNILNIFTIPKSLISVFLDGCLTSGTVWLIHTLQERMEKFQYPEEK